jgi:hypothetical protein
LAVLRLGLKGLAASFGATHLVTLADEASEGAPGDLDVIRKLNNAIFDIEHFIVQ